MCETSPQLQLSNMSTLVQGLEGKTKSSVNFFLAEQLLIETQDAQTVAYGVHQFVGSRFDGSKFERSRKND